MPTNDERRELAARLREPFDVLPQGRYYHASHTLFGMGLYTSSEVALRLGVCRLADLIEPEERTCYVEHIDDDSFHLSCGHEAAGHVSPSFCPYCGAKVVEQ